MSTIAQTTDNQPEDQVPGMAEGLRDLGEWLVTLAGVLDRMPQIQRRELLRSTRGLRRDLHSIRLSVPGTDPRGTL